MEPRKILIVDDVFDNLKLGKAIFESDGYHVLFAQDGVEAMDILLLNPDIGLIITDILMPNMDGFTLCNKIRSHKKTFHIPIIIYSATYTSETDEKFSIEMGANIFIRKPSSYQVLLSAAKKLFNTPGNNGYQLLMPHENSNVTQLYNKKLIETLEQKSIELEQRNRELEQFSYIISHNLNGQVANIVTATNLLKLGDLDQDDQDELIPEINKSAISVQSTLNDLNEILKIKKIDATQNKKIALSEIIDEIKTNLYELINRENAIVTYDLSNIDEIHTFKSYIYSILFNLISNGIKYRQAHISPVINITSTLIDNKIILSIKDNGLGIDLNKNRDKIFSLYKRFHSHVEGKGMGLYMVKTQVESLGGSIRIESELNKGTEFIIEFVV